MFPYTVCSIMINLCVSVDTIRMDVLDTCSTAVLCSIIPSSNGNISALLVLCAGNSPVTGEFHLQRPVTRSFEVFFDLRPNKRLRKQSWCWWYEAPSRSWWRQCNEWCLIFVRPTPKPEMCHDANFVVIGGIKDCYTDNLRCPQWQQSGPLFKSLSSVYVWRLWFVNGDLQSQTVIGYFLLGV